MASSLNKVQIIGNLTADPEIRETPNGQKVASFSVATNRKWKDASGTFQEDVEFHNCVAWRWLADTAEQYMHKGKKVYIEGYLKTRSWDDPSGVKRYKTEIISDSIILLSANSEGNSGTENVSFSGAVEAPPAEAAKPKKAKVKVEEEIDESEIPF